MFVSTHRTSVAVRVCPSPHIGRSWLYVNVRVCPCVSVSTHMTSVAVHQYTYHHVGPWTPHADPSCGLFRVILALVGCLFSTHRTSVGVRQHTQDVCGCLWVSVSTHRTSMAVCVCLYMSVGVRQHTQDVCGCLWVSVSTHRTSVAVCGCLSAHTSR